MGESLPLLLTVFIVGTIVGVLQAATTIHDPSIGQVTRLLAGGVALVVGGGWTFGICARFMSLIYSDFVRFLGG